MVHSLLISCPDQKGIVAKITQFLFEHDANITKLEQHIENNMFFMRVEWNAESVHLSEREFLEAFSMLKESLNAKIVYDRQERKKRVGLFCSKEGHCLADILGRVTIHELPIEIPYVISNHEDLRELVESFKIPFYKIETTTGNFEHEKICLEIIKQNATDIIALARYMKVLSKEFIQELGQKIINVHHSFLPSFIGARPYHDAHDRGVKLIGATSHYVIPALDEGPIIEQRVKRIHHSHDIKKLKLLGRECEKEAFAFGIQKHIENKTIIFENRVIVFE